MGGRQGVQPDHNGSQLKEEDNKLQGVDMDKPRVGGLQTAARGNGRGPNQIEPKAQVVTVGTTTGEAGITIGIKMRKPGDDQAERRFPRRWVRQHIGLDKFKGGPGRGIQGEKGARRPEELGFFTGNEGLDPVGQGGR
jgi:hypothetical protein